MIDRERYAAILRRAKDLGFQGIGEACGPAALAIRRVLLPEGRLVASANKTFWTRAGSLIGHVAVEVEGRYFDADGKAREWFEIKHWGMLDLEDSDWVLRAADEGISWMEVDAYETLRIEPAESDVIEAFGDQDLDRFVDILRRAQAEVDGATKTPSASDA